MICSTKSDPYGSIGAHKGPYGPIWAPTRTGPQPGLGPNPGPCQVSTAGVHSGGPQRGARAGLIGWGMGRDADDHGPRDHFPSL